MIKFKITDSSELERFAVSLQEKLKGAEFPSNVKLVLELSEDEFNNIVPPEAREFKDLEINTLAGIRFYPKIKNDE